MLIGLTGGIGAGKSSALKCFSDLGWKTLDADTICHELYCDESCEAYKLMVNRWGEKIVAKNRTIDRTIVAQFVFKDPKEREWLNKMLHPMVLDCAIEEYSKCDATVPVIFDVPLLFEAEWENYFTKIITIYATEEVQVERLKNRGMKVEDIKRRVASQMSLNEKVERSDYALINNGSVELLTLQCQKLHATIYGSIDPVKIG